MFRRGLFFTVCRKFRVVAAEKKRSKKIIHYTEKDDKCIMSCGSSVAKLRQTEYGQQDGEQNYAGDSPYCPGENPEYRYREIYLQ